MEIQIKINCLLLRTQNRVETRLVYHIDKGLGIVLREVANHLNLIVVREDCCDYGDALIPSEGITDQPFPGWYSTAVVKLMLV